MDMVKSLHVDEMNVRIAYLPYNTEVFEIFGFNVYKTKARVIEALGMFITIDISYCICGVA